MAINLNINLRPGSSQLSKRQTLKIKRGTAHKMMGILLNLWTMTKKLGISVQHLVKLNQNSQFIKTENLSIPTISFH